MQYVVLELIHTNESTKTNVIGLVDGKDSVAALADSFASRVRACSVPEAKLEYRFIPVSEKINVPAVLRRNIEAVIEQPEYWYEFVHRTKDLDGNITIAVNGD